MQLLLWYNLFEVRALHMVEFSFLFLELIFAAIWLIVRSSVWIKNRHIWREIGVEASRVGFGTQAAIATALFGVS